MFTIRPFQPADNTAVAVIIRGCVAEVGYPNSEYLKKPELLENLFDTYNKPKSRFYVLVETATGEVVGCGGYAPLHDDKTVGEIQKLYFAPRVRGKGYGKILTQRLVSEAEQEGFVSLYIETVPEMQTAIALYGKLGFVRLAKRLTVNGIDYLTVYMLRPCLANEMQREAG